MRLILIFSFVMIALLSPVSAQELPAPHLAFNVDINSTQAIISWDTVPGVTDYLYVIRPTPRCDSGAALVSATGDLWSRVGLFNPSIPYTVTVTSMVNDVAHGSATVTWTPPRTLSNVLIPDFRVPTAVSWLSTGLWETGMGSSRGKHSTFRSVKLGTLPQLLWMTLSATSDSRFPLPGTGETALS